MGQRELSAGEVFDTRLIDLLIEVRSMARKVIRKVKVSVKRKRERRFPIHISKFEDAL